jgi:hypothetical protein
LNAADDGDVAGRDAVGRALKLNIGLLLTLKPEDSGVGAGRGGVRGASILSTGGASAVALLLAGEDGVVAGGARLLLVEAEDVAGRREN